MWGAYEESLRREAQKTIRKYESHARWVAEENRRRSRRSSAAVDLVRLTRPAYWEHDSGFDPYLVRARAERISHAVRRRLRSQSYQPFAPTAFEVPKGESDVRRVSVFQLPDAVVSTLLFRGLMEKNAVRFSAHSFAYRRDRGVFEAVGSLGLELAGRSRLYVAEYDFSKFFASIQHDYIRDVLERDRYLITPLERHLIDAFLASGEPTTPYSREGAGAREAGLAEGTSVSLFLANVAATPLDRALERIGVGFARYADDTLIFDADYGRVAAAVDRLYELSEAMGVRVNHEKSKGIRLLTRDADAPAEITRAERIDYLGHSLRPATTQMKEAVVRRIEGRVQRLIFDNLLRAPLNGTQSSARIGRVDKDYVVLIWQLRRYIYGNLSEREIARLARSDIPLRKFRGVMSFFPLVDDIDQLRGLDNWVAEQVWLGMRRRAQLLRAASLPVREPHDLSIQQLRTFQRRSATTGGTLDLRLPRFTTVSHVIRRAAAQHGPAAVGRGGSVHYAYGS